MSLIYDEVIMPYKGALEEWYVRNESLTNYLLVIFVTTWVVIFPKSRIAWSVFSGLPNPPEELTNLVAV